MKKYIFICFMTLASNSVFADDDGFKEQTLNDYEARCKAVLGYKGFQQNVANQECACEVKVIDKYFSSFKLLITGAKTVAGMEPLTEKETKIIKSKISKCKKEYLK